MYNLDTEKSQNAFIPNISDTKIFLFLPVRVFEVKYINKQSEVLIDIKKSLSYQVEIYKFIEKAGSKMEELKKTVTLITGMNAKFMNNIPV